MDLQSILLQIPELSPEALFVAETTLDSCSSMKIVWCNDALLHLTGCDREHLIGQPLLFLFAPATHVSLDQELHTAIEERRRFYKRCKLQRPDGIELSLETAITPVHGEVGNRKACVGSLREFSETVVNYEDLRDQLKDAQETAEQAHQRFAEAVEALPQGFVMLDQEDRLIVFNQKFKEFYSHSADAIHTGATWESILRYGLENGQYPEADGHEEEWLAERLDRNSRQVSTAEQNPATGRSKSRPACA